jgi:hypothetical protein
VSRRRRRGVGEVLGGPLTVLRNRGITDVFFVVCDLADKWEQRYPAMIRL